MRRNDRFGLLYNQLWIGTLSKVKELDSEYVYPEYLDIASGIVSKTVVDSVNNHVVKSELEHKIKVLPPVTSPQPILVESNKKLASNLINDWDVLINTISDCTKCGLCQGRTNVVIERGSRHAHWLFVGEGPGENEDLQGIPFVGASGQLLDKMIAAMNLEKDQDVYICNVVKCRPPYNRNPEPTEIEACKDYLFSQINNVKPRVIITLGRFAAQTLLNEQQAIGKLRNKVHFFNGIPLIATYHPSYLLRNPSAKVDAWNDLKLAMRAYE